MTYSDGVLITCATAAASRNAASPNTASPNHGPQRHFPARRSVSFGILQIKSSGLPENDVTARDPARPAAGRTRRASPASRGAGSPRPRSSQARPAGSPRIIPPAYCPMRPPRNPPCNKRNEAKGSTGKLPLKGRLSRVAASLTEESTCRISSRVGAAQSSGRRGKGVASRALSTTSTCRGERR
jgi:hypothetical protein